MSRTESAWTRLALAITLGTAAGAGEIAYLGLRKYVRHLFIFHGTEVLWLSPLAGVLVALLAALPFVLAPARTSWRTFLAVQVAVLAASGMLLYPPLHGAAGVLLATGIGIQAARLLASRAEWVAGLGRTLAVPCLVAIALVAGATQALPGLRERRTVGGLPEAAPGLPNVLLIVLDTVRSWDMSAYGYPVPTTPWLERWSSRGVRFERVLSPSPWTLPSHASLFTGRPEHELSTDWFTPLDGTYPTLAEVLASRGYHTVGIVANTVYCSRETGLARGFARYDDYEPGLRRLLHSNVLFRRVSTAGVPVAGQEKGPVDRLLRSRFLIDIAGRKYAREVGDRFLGWLDGRDDRRPFFAFLNYYDAHTPLFPPDSVARRFLPAGSAPMAELPYWPKVKGDRPPEEALARTRATYDASIAYLDAELERLFTELERRGVLDSTIVVITSDHGEEFLEHGIFGHGNTAYRAAVQVPLFIAYPGRVPAGPVPRATVSLRDVAATILDLAGLPADGIAGQSLAPFWAADGAAREPVLAGVRRAWLVPDWFPTMQGDVRSVTAGGLRYIRTGPKREELFDFERDSLEQADLAGDPARAADLARLRAVFDSVIGAAPRER